MGEGGGRAAAAWEGVARVAAAWEGKGLEAVWALEAEAVAAEAGAALVVEVAGWAAGAQEGC